MKTSANQQVVSIVDTLTDYLFSDKLDQSLVEQREVLQKEDFIPMNDVLFEAVMSKSRTPEQEELLGRYTKQSLRTMEKVEDFVIFHLDGIRYHVKRLPESYTVYSKYQAPDFSNLPAKFKEPVVNDIDVIHERFIELTSLYPKKSFVTFNNKDRYSSNEFKDYCIARVSTYYSVAYVSVELLELCAKFQEAFTPEQLDIIENHKKSSFQAIKPSQQALEAMFKAWKKLLTKKKASAAKVFDFNDCDNHAYLEETATHVLISQRSQNTLYAYVFEKATGRYKVWTASTEIKAAIDDFYYSEMVEDCANYLEMVQRYVGCDYGPATYPVMIEHDDYIKSAEYHLEHFEDDEGLVYDSVRGFNLQSDDSGNLMSDFQLLIDVIRHYN